MTVLRNLAKKIHMKSSLSVQICKLKDQR